MIINPSIWILIIPSILFLFYLALKRNKVAIFALCWFVATYLIWIPISLITDRVSYDYYFYPTVGAVCIGISLLFSQIKHWRINNQVLKITQRLLSPLYLGVSALLFVFLYLGNFWLRAAWVMILYSITLFYLDRLMLNEPIEVISHNNS